MARMMTNRSASGQRPPRSAAWYISPEARQHMIDEAAYYRFVQRGGAPGHELEDWLAAEAEFERNAHQNPPRPARRGKWAWRAAATAARERMMR